MHTCTCMRIATLNAFTCIFPFDCRINNKHFLHFLRLQSLKTRGLKSLTCFPDKKKKNQSRFSVFHPSCNKQDHKLYPQGTTVLHGIFSSSIVHLKSTVHSSISGVRGQARACSSPSFVYRVASGGCRLYITVAHNRPC